MRPRLIPVLTLDRKRRLVKTVGFGQRTYIGDPFNVIRLFNEKEVDELVVLDIDATVDGRVPDPGFVAELAQECFMPLSYGGGLKDIDLCRRLARFGVEKFVLGSAVTEPGLIRAMADIFGSQAIVGCVDVRGSGVDGAAFARSGQSPVGMTALDLALRLQDEGCGEIILQSIDRDGARNGYDTALIAAVAPRLAIPVVTLGGAGDFGHFGPAFAVGASACASGSAFCFIGALRAVLVSYPSGAEIEGLNTIMRGARAA